MQKPMHRQAKPLINSTQVYKGRSEFRPAIISAKRYDGITSRAHQEKKLAQLAAVEEERRYRQYLLEGSEALTQHFGGMLYAPKEDSANLTVDQEAEETKPQQTKLLADQIRRDRIIRAKKILDGMKPGPRALHRALLESEQARQRTYYEQVNREIAREAELQQELEERMCPEVLIPFTHKTEAQLAAEQKAKALAVRDSIMQDVEAKRQRELDEKERETIESIEMRAQHKYLQDKEEQAARELAARKREWCRNAYHDAMREKAKIAENERICDIIDDRRNCVYLVAQRNLSRRFNNHVKEMRVQTIKNREAIAKQLGKINQEKEQRIIELDEEYVERHEMMVQCDEERRNCEIKELAKQRIAYQKVERQEAADRREKEFERQRFETAQRFKNAEAHKLFEASAKRKRDKAAANLHCVLTKQRNEFIKQRQEELMNMDVCKEDPHLMDDKVFFSTAVEMMNQSKEIGRPVYPIAKVVEQYKRENNVDLVPQGRLVGRNKQRDDCWPGYYSKAELAYRKYEHRDKCREEAQDQRNQNFADCIKITKMAAEERPWKPCIVKCPINCHHQSGMPGIESTESFDYCRYMPQEVEPPMGQCEADMAAKAAMAVKKPSNSSIVKSPEDQPFDAQKPAGFCKPFCGAETCASYVRGRESQTTQALQAQQVSQMSVATQASTKRAGQNRLAKVPDAGT